MASGRGHDGRCWLLRHQQRWCQKLQRWLQLRRLQLRRLQLRWLELLRQRWRRQHVGLLRMYHAMCGSILLVNLMVVVAHWSQSCLVRQGEWRRMGDVVPRCRMVGGGWARKGWTRCRRHSATDIPVDRVESPTDTTVERVESSNHEHDVAAKPSRLLAVQDWGEHSVHSLLLMRWHVAMLLRLYLLRWRWC